MSPRAGQWTLQGEAMVAFTARRPQRPTLPRGLSTVPGPAMVTATRYTQSPVGPFLELAVAEPVRLGARVGWCRTLVVVDRDDVRLGDRLQWGFPAERGMLRWFVRDEERELVWDDRDIVVRGRGLGPTWPYLSPQRTLQQRNSEPVVVPGHVRGMARAARVTVQTMPGDALVGLAGRHLGIMVAGLHRVWHDARLAERLRPSLAPAGGASASHSPDPAVLARAGQGSL
jgi:hypothetical protein